jgi:hypothetical protein
MEQTDAIGNRTASGHFNKALTTSPGVPQILQALRKPVV